LNEKRIRRSSDANIEAHNRRVYDAAQALPLEFVLTDACQTFVELIKAIRRLPDRYFEDPECARWFMEPYWSNIRTVPEAVIDLSVDHYEEHIPARQAWIQT
jgi:hypothetical protein